MTKDCDMPLYTNPKYVDVGPRGDGSEAIGAIFLGGLGVVVIGSLVAFILAHMLMIILGVVGIAAVLTVETVVLYRRFTVVYLHPDANALMQRGAEAKQGRVPAAIPAPAVRRPVGVRPPAIEGRRAPLLNLNLTLNLFGRRANQTVDAPARAAIEAPRPAIPGFVIRNDELGQAVAEVRKREAS